MKEKLNFNNINLNEDFRDVVKRDLNSKLRESASLPKLGRVQLGKGYKKPFADNKRLTEMRTKDNFSFRDSYLESLDLNDGGKSTSVRLKEAEEEYNGRRKPLERRGRRPIVNSRVEPMEKEGPSMQDALDAYLARERRGSLAESRRLPRKRESSEYEGMSMQDALDAYLAKEKRNSLAESRRLPRTRESSEYEGMSMQDALDAYLAKEKRGSLAESRKLPRKRESSEYEGMSMQDALDAYLARERGSLDESERRKHMLRKKFDRKASPLNESSSMKDVLFFMVKTPKGKYLCKDEKNKFTENMNPELAEAYDTFEEAENAVRRYAGRVYDDKVSSFEIRGIEASDFKENSASCKRDRLSERNNPVKDINVDFSVSVSDAGHVRASDAKRLLKYLYSSKQLRAGTQYFIKDINGRETSWDFGKCISNNGYQYCFSCEIVDDDKDVYQALYISKDYKGRLDWSDTEWVREAVK